MKTLVSATLCLLFLSFAGCAKHDSGSEFRVTAQLARNLTGREDRADVRAILGEPTSKQERDDRAVWQYFAPKNWTDDLRITFSGDKILGVILTESGETYVRDFRQP